MIFFIMPDMMQIVTPNTKIYNWTTKKIIDEQAVIEKFGVKPELVSLIQALIGDACIIYLT
jgi:5'-3' exonuclease